MEYKNVPIPLIVIFLTLEHISRRDEIDFVFVQKNLSLIAFPPPDCL